MDLSLIRDPAIAARGSPSKPPSRLPGLDFFPLVDCHPRCHRRFQVVHVDAARIGLLFGQTLPEQVGLETCAEVVHAVEAIGDGE